MFAFSLLTALHFICIVIDIKSRVEAVNASTLFCFWEVSLWRSVRDRSAPADCVW